MINFFKYIVKIYYKIFFKVNLIGEENLPLDSGYVLCANHISNHDPLVYASSVKRLFYALGKNELFNNSFTKKFFSTINVIPVDRTKIDISAMKKSLRILKKEKSGLLIFPEGTRSRDGNPLPITPGVSMLAIKAKVPIIPVSIDSSYKLFSSINIKIHKPIDMSEYYTQRLDTEEYISINSKIIKDIYNELSLYKLRKNYENHSS